MEKVYHFNEYLYEDLDSAKLPMFSGGFVNFGLWKGIDYKNLNINSKIREITSINLYSEVVKYINIMSDDIVLEVGCGAGTGIPVIWNQYRPKKIIGLDVSNKQIVRATENNLHLVQEGAVALIAKPAENTGLLKCSINKIIAIESLQNLNCLPSFFTEANRILTDQGKIVISTIFSKHKTGADRINGLKPKNMKRKDHIYCLDDVINQCHHLFDFNVTSIGEHVFEGYHQYLLQLNLLNEGIWSSNFYNAFKNDWIDYNIVLLSKKIKDPV